MDTKAIEMYKEHNTNVFNGSKFFWKSDIEAAFSHESNIFNSIEDGISILDKDLNVISINFTMQTWYSMRRRIIGRKCYSVYHDREKPCIKCPILKTLETGQANRDIISYYIKKNNVSGWHELLAIPIMDGEKITGVVEYVKDITYEVDLYSKICNIEREMDNIKKQNEILKTYIDQKEMEKKDIENNITSNVRKFVKPVIKQMKDGFAERPLEYEMISFLDNLFENIVTPYLSDSSSLKDFTSREIQIMSLIKGGKTSKEIAEIMCLSTKTVDFHRANIRKKLGLEQGKDNLRSYLLRSMLTLE